MNIETAIRLYSTAEENSYNQNLYARANARYILFGVDEPKENFPETLENNLNNGSDTLGILYLSIACALFEAKETSNEIMQLSFEKGAEFIEYNHLPEQNRNELSQYYLLISALAYYAANQYSKAFIVIKEAENYQTDLSLLCSYFIRKNFSGVHRQLNKILLEDYIDTDNDGSEKQQVFIFAKSITNLLDYLYTGNEISLNTAIEIQDDLLELLQIENEPSLWWVVRLFKIITSGFRISSLWTNVLPVTSKKSGGETVRGFINNLIFGKKSIIELFTAQRNALPLIFNEKGGVVSLPTSSGKTQIAALAILQCLVENPDAKILYLAPYRSLAFEVETTLKEIFEPINFEVSQLYGTGQFSKLDRLIIEDAQVLIATPEKAKVILRANEDIATQIKLVIIDEGHLLDETKRYVTNELFIEELKVYIQRNKGKIILLSAVLPNTAHIAKWICEDEKCSVSGKERLARQRIGILEFIEKRNLVNLEWKGEEASFNNSFIRPITFTDRRKNTQPQEVENAIAYAALKLSDKNKSLLIFSARATSVPTYAKALVSAIKVLGQARDKHQWTDQRGWEELKLLCSEYDSTENKRLIEFAEYGILCHYGGLNREVRTALEKLMKNGNPRIIVATMTLGQGVNLGVSTVILANTSFYDVKKKKQIELSGNEIWNIIGRAGRAFQDIEGKILFAVETKSDRDKALQYIDQVPADAYSGLLKKIDHIIAIASEIGINFETLIELIANNDLDKFKSKVYIATNENVKKDFEDVFDWIDDTLLSLNILIDFDSGNIDDNFRKTLAFIQATDFPEIDPNDVFKFLKARNEALKNVIVPDKADWKSFVSSSLPLASAISLNKVFDKIVALAEAYLSSKKSIKEKIELVKDLEEIIETFPSSSFKPQLNDNGGLKFPKELIEEARNAWISGKPLDSVNDIKKVIKICNDYFAYTITWVLGAIANKCKTLEREDLATLFEELSLSCELGLPNILGAKLYLVGIRSRTAALEISDAYSWAFSEDMSLRDLKKSVLLNLDSILEDVSNPITIAWLNAFQVSNIISESQKTTKFSAFTLPDYPDIKTSRLYVKTFDDKEYFLCSYDYDEKYSIENSSKWPFEKFANRLDYYFEFVNKNWVLTNSKRN